MLESYQKRIEQFQESNPISPEAFALWKKDPITLRLGQHFEKLWINEANSTDSKNQLFLACYTYLCEELRDFNPCPETTEETPSE